MQVTTKMKILFILLLLSSGVFAQSPATPSDLKVLGTRSWIRLQWKDNANNEQGFKIYWSTANRKPTSAGAVVEANESRYYIQNVDEQTKYYVWVEAYNSSGSSNSLKEVTTTVKMWILDPEELNELNVSPSSAAVPKGMELFWQDEFNDELLNRNKWSTNYYSTIDFQRKDNLQAMRDDRLPQPAFKLNGSTIDLFTNDSLPVKIFDVKSRKKISSIQTYDWRSNENLLDNSRGGYFEVRVKRSSTGKPRGLNTAFWFDSPGPDLKYYLEEGTTIDGTKGIRPSGQVFEIDVFEMLNAQFVLHGTVDKNGKFIHNLATHVAKGYTHADNWVTHGMLWTPTSIKHYINGTLIKEYTDKHQIYSPNHFMNVFLGSYGGGGTVNMEVDYIRGYQWPLVKGNELPNPGFEANTNFLPWEGTGKLSDSAKRSGNYGLVLEPGQSIEQYVYLNNNALYQLKYWSKGNAKLHVIVENITPVSGNVETRDESTTSGRSVFVAKTLNFKTESEYGDHMKTVRVKFTNEGSSVLTLDDITVVKRK